MRKYFKVVKTRKWVFATNEGKELLRHGATKIVRHIKVQGSRSPFDGDWAYWATRLGHSPLLSPRRARLLKEQKGKCGYCKLHFRHEDILEVHHVDGNHKNNKRNNLMLIHGHCHDQITAQMQQFPLMACEAYTTYVGGVSMGNVTPHWSLLTPQVPSKGRHPGRQADSGLFPDALPPWGWSLSRWHWVGPSGGVERSLRKNRNPRWERIS